MHIKYQKTAHHLVLLLWTSYPKKHYPHRDKCNVIQNKEKLEATQQFNKVIFTTILPFPRQGQSEVHRNHEICGNLNELIKKVYYYVFRHFFGVLAKNTLDLKLPNLNYGPFQTYYSIVQ